MERSHKELREQWLIDLQGFPPEFRYLPANARKVPLDPATGKSNGWEQLPGLPLDGLIALNGMTQSVSLQLGRKSGGLLLVDPDTPNFRKAFQERFGRGVFALPPTTRHSSGREGVEASYLYRVPATYARMLDERHCTRKGFRWKDSSEDQGCDDFELFWSGHCIVAGKHPNNKLNGKKVAPGKGNGQGFYSFMEGFSPNDLEVAEAPKFLIEALLVDQDSRKTEAKAKSQEPKGEHPWSDAARAQQFLKKELLPATNWADYDSWLSTGMICNHTSQRCGDSELLFEAFNEWCKGMGSAFDEAENRAEWDRWTAKGIQPGHQGFGTLVHMVQKAGGDPLLVSNIKPDQFKTGLLATGHEHTKKVWADIEAAQKEVAATGPLQKRLFKVIRDELYNAIRERDLNKEMELRAEMGNDYRLNPDKIDLALFKFVKEKAIGFGPGKKKPVPRSDQSVNFKKVKGTDWLLPGFIPGNDITLIWGMRGAGKTRLALESAIALMQGLGLLDRQRNKKAKPVKVLFCASDSGAEPLKDELLDMGIDPETDELFQGDLWQLWAHCPGAMDSWGADVRGRIDLYEWARKNPGACVFIDSVKTISTKGGFSYADNEQAASFLDFLKEAICPLVTVVLLAHDGTKAHRAGGAAAWEEHPSMVIGLEKLKSVDGQELSGKRQFAATKCRKCDERTFFYEKGEDGRLQTCLGTEVIRDISELIVKVMVDAHDNNEDKLHFKVIHERVKERLGSLVSLKTIQNNLSNLTRGNTPRLKRVGTPTGTYRVNDYWLRISRGTQA